MVIAHPAEGLDVESPKALHVGPADELPVELHDDLPSASLREPDR